MNDDDPINNPSPNRPFRDILGARTSRRRLMMGGLALAASGFLSTSLGCAAVGSGRDSRQESSKTHRQGLISFTPVPVATGSGPIPAISDDYRYQVLVPWGDALRAGVRDYEGDPLHRPTAAEQAQQVGIGHDGMWFFPFRRSSGRGLLAINHEFGSNAHVLGKPLPANLEEVLRSQHAHGMSVVEIRRNREGLWSRVQGSEYNRRIHANTPVAFSGPVAGSNLIAPEADAQGTLANCSSGQTTWDTYLTCEENFDGYFGAADVANQAETRTRYGLSSGASLYGWELFDNRFSLSSPGYPNEDNRFGWVVEVDPFDPDAMPVKRTALGRFSHEGATVTVGRDGRVVVYMGDDERFEYIYKFVSADDWRTLRAEGRSPLDHGTLYAARFNEDGTGEWLPLTLENPRISARFGSQAEVLTFARIAADLAGATPMDRPEWISVAPTGDLYCTLTNNTERVRAHAANPMAPNPAGHIIRWRDSARHTGTRFTWDILLLARDTHGDGDERTFSNPDGLWIDPDGRMFILTDGGQKQGLNNQLLVVDTGAGGQPDIRRLLTGVTGDEVTGITVTPDRRTLFVNLQHPGRGDPSLTSFPAAQGSGRIPRDCTLVITRKDGGIVGS